jgi:hypothetical protein
MNRDFKGIWIPREIWLAEDLTLQEKVFLVEIHSLDNEDGCFASNDYFAKFFGVSKVRVSEVINSLVKKGLITSTVIKAEGNKRILKTLLKKSLRGSQTKVEDPIKEKFAPYIRKNNTESNAERAQSAAREETRPGIKTASPYQPDFNPNGKALVGDGAAWGESPAEEIYREFFGGLVLRPEQHKLFPQIKNLAVWRRVCKLWRDNGSRASMLGNMVDRYENELARENQGKGFQTAGAMRTGFLSDAIKR